MLSDQAVTAAMEAGTAAAGRVQAFRARELRRRARAIARNPTMSTLSADELPASAVRAAGPDAIGTLVAEGDSWFDYPLHDVLRYLEDRHGYEVESVAHAGDRVEQMAYDDGQLEELARRFERLVRRQVVPRAVLLSGGGNDLSGAEFGMLLNHRRSALAGLSGPMLEGLVDERVKSAYITIVSRITGLTRTMFGRSVPVLVHGYDYPHPDGRGLAGGWGFLPGPWLAPGFDEKGFSDMADRTPVVVALIDRFNQMLAAVAALPAFAHVHYIDLRGTLSSRNYRADWANELHPTPKGFQLVTNRFAQVLAALPA